MFLPAGIYDVLDGELEALGFSSECVGGGKIEHNPAGKVIVVFGASQVRTVRYENTFQYFLSESYYSASIYKCSTVAI